MIKKGFGRKSQITIFIIIAIIIVAWIVSFFLLKDKIFIKKFPAKFDPIEIAFLECVKSRVEEGKNILGEQAGYINLPEFVHGSSYAPFSNQLSFQGQVVPYWYYLSGNLVKEKVPAKAGMQDELERYAEENLDCDFSEFEIQGYEINFSKPDINIKINELDIEIEINSDLNVKKEDESGIQTQHKTKIDTSFGRLYSQALKIYNYEKQQAFLENYAVDVLRLYAPVDGLEISCAPKIWMPENVVSELQEALEENVQAIKTSSDYYQASEENRYFVVDVNTDDAVNFIYDRDWPFRIEIWPAENNIMLAEPVGNQQGLGILGFCYVPYHFLYDLSFPVLIQIYNNKESFQFPVAVVIQKNQPRKSEGAAIEETEIELCKYKNTEIRVSTYNTKIEPVEADIEFKCFNTACEIGKTKIENDDNEAVLVERFPQCINGFVVARAEGYADKAYMLSTNEEGSADIILDRLYNLTLNIEVDGKEAEMAIAYFSGESMQTLAYPEQKSVQLSEGQYNVSVYVYRNSSLYISPVSKQKCVDMPKGGLLGIFGATEEKCFDINLPGQIVSFSLSGGGKTQDYFAESQLQDATNLKIISESLPIPTNIEQLQDNYNLFETKKISIEII